jgi:plasmid stabilization system protein ParE
MIYEVKISDQALEELDAAFTWLRERTPQHAVSWRNNMRESIASLSQFPSRCPLAPENEDHEEEVRHLIVGNRIHAYRIIYIIRKDTVFILDIVHGARDRP